MYVDDDMGVSELMAEAANSPQYAALVTPRISSPREGEGGSTSVIALGNNGNSVQIMKTEADTLWAF